MSDWRNECSSHTTRYDGVIKMCRRSAQTEKHLKQWFYGYVDEFTDEYSYQCSDKIEE